MNDINRETRGLQISPRNNSGNPTPQETTNEESGTFGANCDASLSCSGSSVVADCEDENEA
jgi:hypothetical protein